MTRHRLSIAALIVCIAGATCGAVMQGNPVYVLLAALLSGLLVVVL